MNESDYNITLFEACELLNKSKKTVSRYVRRGRLNPLKVKSQQGTLEYRFDKDDLDRLRAELAIVDTQDGTQDTPPLEKAFLNTKPEETGHPYSIITLLKDTTELLKHQLTIKDTQIETLNDQVHNLIERDRETNILLKGLQDRLMLLGPPENTQDRTGRGGGDRARLLVLVTLLLLTLGVFFYISILPSIKLLRGI